MPEPTTLNPSKRIRGAIYATTLFGAPIVAYLRAKGWIGDLELGLWASEVTAAGTIAYVNTRAVVSGRPESQPSDARPVKKVGS